MTSGLVAGLGLIALAVALVVSVLVIASLRRAQRRAPDTSQTATLSPVSSHTNEAVLIVQSGGRIEYLNELARQWFGFRPDEMPDLERLFRRVRPLEEFIELCTHQGRKRVTVSGQLIEAVSYQVPGPDLLMLIAMRDIELAGNLAETRTDTPILQIITDFGTRISVASLDLEETLHAILLNVSQLIPADFLEIKTWDASRQQSTAYMLDASGAARVQPVARSQFEGFTATIIAQSKPLLIPDTRVSALPASHLLINSSIQSYMGVPLFADQQLTGTLEFGHQTPDALGQHDLNLVNLISAQAAYSIRNAMLFAAEKSRSVELTGLANLAQAFGGSQEQAGLFGRLVDSVKPLFEVDVLGFLLYESGKNTLVAQSPFQGLPSHIVDIYRTNIALNSPAEKIIQSRQPIVTRNAIEDPTWRDLGLQTLARAASLRESVLQPLISGDQLIGYFQVSNHKKAAEEYSESELRLIGIVAAQAAGIIENAVLMDSTHQRANRAESLRRIASLAASKASINEILHYSVQELARLFQSELAAVFLYDEQTGDLRVHTESIVGDLPDAASTLTQLHVDASQYRLTVSGSQKPFLSGRLSYDRHILPSYRPLVTTLQVESCVVVPIVLREHSLGELMLGSQKAEVFDQDDLQTISSVAGLLASALEDAMRATTTDETLRRRVEQLTAIARISRELNSIVDAKSLLEVIHHESVRTTRAGCGTILLLDAAISSGPATTLRTTPPAVALSIGCDHPEYFSAPELDAIYTGLPKLLADLPLADGDRPHDGIRSTLLVPIIFQGRVLGLIYLHSKQAGFFDDAALEIAQTLASQAAVALGNANRYQEQLQVAERLRRRADALTKLSDNNSFMNFDQPIEQSLRGIAVGIRDATPFGTVLISLVESGTRLLRGVVGAGFSQEMLAAIMTRKQPLSSVQQLFKPQFRIGRSYFIPVDQTPVIAADVLRMPFEAIGKPQMLLDAWVSGDSLLAPLEDSQGNLLGVISLDAPRDGQRPDRATIETLEIYASQAALIIHSHNRHMDLRAQMDALSLGMERQQRLLTVTQNDLPILLRKDLDQTIAIQNLDQRAQRVRAGLAITESVSRQLDASTALQALGRETLTQLGMSVALIAETAADGPRLLHVMGSVPRQANPEALFGQRNPLRTCLQSGEAILIANLDENLDWRETPLLTALRTKSLVCLPIKIDKKTVAAMMAISPEPLPVFTPEDLQVYYQIARQTSVILQNISLLNETRRRLQEVNLLLDFSRQLRGLDADRIIRSLLDSARRALNTAHAGAVLIWDEHASQLVPQAVSGYADNDSMKRIAYHAGESLPGQVFDSRQVMRVDEIQFARDYTLSAEGLLYYRQATGGRLPVSSLLIPIQSGEQSIGVLVLDNFNTPAAFKEEDETLLLSLAQQVGLSLQNVRLVQATQERAKQLEALTHASTTLTSSLQSNELVTSLLNQLGPVIPYDTATLWLRDKEQLTVAAARGFPDNERRLGLTVAADGSALFKEMIRTGQGVLVGDVRQDPRFPVLEAPRLSWLGLPLVSKNQVIGVLALEKWQAYAFTREHVQVGTTFASQAAVALENARLFEDSHNRASELDERSQRLALLNRFSSALGGLLDEDKILDLTAQELQDALSASRISVVVFERGQPVWKYVTPKSKTKKLPAALPDAPVFQRLQESLGVFITDSVNSEPDLAPLSSFLGEATQSLLILPIISGQNLRALIFIHQYATIRFSLAEIELARTLTNQASIALESARLFQSASQTAGRFRALNQASYQVGANLDPEQIYVAVHNAAKQLMPAESFVISLLDEATGEIEVVYLVDGDKRAPISRLSRDQGLSGRVISTGEPLLLHGAEAAENMGAVRYARNSTPLSILAVPIMLSGRTIGMLSVQSYQPNVYTEDDQQILNTLANQAAVAIQNGRLFNETQRLAQELEQRVVERTAQLMREQQNTETLLRILTEVSSSLDLDRALNRTLALLNDAIGAEQGTIMLRSVEDNMLHFRAGYGYLSDRISGEGRGFKLKIGEGLAGWVVENRESALIPDLLADPRWVKNTASSREHRSAIVTPLLVAEDVIGVLMVFHRKAEYFSAEILNVVKAIAGQVAVAINNAHLYELIRDQAERLGSMLRREQEDASRSQAILEAVADGVLVTGASNRISFLNRSAEQILDLETGHVVGQPLDVFGGLFGKAASSWMQTIHTWSETPSSYEGETFAEQLDLQNGRIVLVHLAPVILQNDFLGTVSIFRDITHEVEVDRLKSEFVATVSHELRTPMTSIRGYTDVLLMGAAGALNENQTHFLKIIKNNTERLNILVNDLLDISRIEAGRVTLSPQPLDLRELAEDVIEDILRRSQEENKPMALSLDAPRKLPLVNGDVERVRQILTNIIYNAYHYTPENGTIKVQIQPLNGGHEVQVNVVDNGIGISLEDQERVFQRFYRGEHPLVLATPGTGLGLSIVKQLVEMHNGRIWMKSSGVPGEGSVFSFTLPVDEKQ